MIPNYLFIRVFFLYFRFVLQIGRVKNEIIFHNILYKEGSIGNKGVMRTVPAGKPHKSCFFDRASCNI